MVFMGGKATYPAGVDHYRLPHGPSSTVCSAANKLSDLNTPILKSLIVRPPRHGSIRLQTTGLCLKTRAAAQTAWLDQRYFIRKWHQVTGQLPSEWVFRHGLIARLRPRRSQVSRPRTARTTTSSEGQHVLPFPGRICRLYRGPPWLLSSQENTQISLLLLLE